jgi:hypothetical protein
LNDPSEILTYDPWHRMNVRIDLGDYYAKFNISRILIIRTMKIKQTNLIQRFMIVLLITDSLCWLTVGTPTQMIDQSFHSY